MCHIMHLVANLYSHHKQAIKVVYRARLGVTGHLPTTLNAFTNDPKCKLVLHTVPLLLSVNQGSCE